MFEALFGTELPLALRFFIAFVFVLGLIGGAAYLVRRFGAGALSSAAARGRQPRLAVVDSAPIDGRRRLVIVRRDNVEHLVMIGGPSDVVVETNIVRAAPATAAREPASMRVAPEPMTRHAQAPEGNMWPLQPEPLTPPQRAPMEEPAWSSAMAEPAIRANSDRLAGLATELGRIAPGPAAGRPMAEPAPTRSPDTRSPDIRSPDIRPPEYVAARPAPEPRRMAPVPPQPPAAPPAPPPAPAPAAPTSSDEQNLAEMAHRLEAALRRPNAHGPAPAEATMNKPSVEQPVLRPTPAEHIPAPRPAAAEAPHPEPKFAPVEHRFHEIKPVEPMPADITVQDPRIPQPRMPEQRIPDPRIAETRMAEPRIPELKIPEPRIAEPKIPEPRAAEPKPQSTKSVYDSLEQEMASLLGRPSGKP
jgi:hypothetical protein